LLAIQSEEKQFVLMGLFIAGFFMSWYHGPVTAFFMTGDARRAHATSVGVYMFATQFVGGLGTFKWSARSLIFTTCSSSANRRRGLVCARCSCFWSSTSFAATASSSDLDAFHAEPYD